MPDRIRSSDHLVPGRWYLICEPTTGHRLDRLYLLSVDSDRAYGVDHSGRRITLSPLGTYLDSVALVPAADYPDTAALQSIDPVYSDQA